MLDALVAIMLRTHPLQNAFCTCQEDHPKCTQETISCTRAICNHSSMCEAEIAHRHAMKLRTFNATLFLNLFPHWDQTLSIKEEKKCSHHFTKRRTENRMLPIHLPVSQLSQWTLKMEVYDTKGISLLTSTMTGLLWICFGRVVNVNVFVSDTNNQ